jgi:hypothetical protein
VRRTDREDKNSAASSKAMHSDDRQYDIAERQIGLEERRFALLKQKIYMGATIVLLSVTVSFPVLGVRAQAPLIAGGSTALTGAVAFFEGRRANRPDE